jgi:hypothetical protein
VTDYEREIRWNRSRREEFRSGSFPYRTARSLRLMLILSTIVNLALLVAVCFNRCG